MRIHRTTPLLGIAIVVSVAIAASCSTPEPPPPPPVEVTPPADGTPYDLLSQWHLFANGPEQLPADRVIPYELNAPLFSDYAEKHRFIYVPKGAAIGYDDDGEWVLPPGTILVKTFAFRAILEDTSSKLRLVETRILWRQVDGSWSVATYAWNDTQTDAEREIAGRDVPVDFVDKQGVPTHEIFTIPNTAGQCQECHMTGNTASADVTKGNGFVTPLGLKTRQLNRTHDYGAGVGDVNQIDHFAKLGLFASAPSAPAARPALVDPIHDTSAKLLPRVRAYWDGNCAHCHTTGGFASAYGLHLDFPSTDPDTRPRTNWGICKPPTSVGSKCENACNQSVDIVPGDPDASLMVCRVGPTTPQCQMPPVGRYLAHKEWGTLLHDWVASLPPESCSAPAGG